MPRGPNYKCHDFKSGVPGKFRELRASRDGRHQFNSGNQERLSRRGGKCTGPCEMDRIYIKKGLTGVLSRGKWLCHDAP